MSERFNDIGPFPGCEDISLERDTEQYPLQVGKLWLGSSWFTVAEARALRDWLNRALPNETPAPRAAP